MSLRAILHFAGRGSRAVGLGLGVAAALASAGSAAQDGPAPRPQLTLSVESGRLSLDAREAPLESVLRAVAREGGFALEMRGGLGGVVSDTFEGLPLDRAIPRLAGKNSFVIEWRPEKTTDGVREFRRLLVISRKSLRERRLAAVASGRSARASARGTAGGGLGYQATMREIRMLGRDRSRGAAENLSDFLLNDHDPLVRLTAAKALARFSNDELAADALISAVDDTEVSVRLRAIVALGNVGGEQAVGKLIDILYYHLDAQDQVLAARALARNPSLQTRHALIDAARDPNSRVRMAAEASLSRLERAR